MPKVLGKIALGSQRLTHPIRVTLGETGHFLKMSSRSDFKINPRDVKYEIVVRDWGGSERRRLGRGAYASVYAATYADEPVAVKVIETQGHPLEEEDAELFWREAELQYGLRNDHIVAVHGAFVDDRISPPEHGVVMQRMALTLQDLLYKGTAGPPPLPQRLNIVYQVSFVPLHFCIYWHLLVKPGPVRCRSLWRFASCTAATSSTPTSSPPTL
jgi:hypothetical protein